MFKLKTTWLLCSSYNNNSQYKTIIIIFFDFEIFFFTVSYASTLEPPWADSQICEQTPNSRQHRGTVWFSINSYVKLPLKTDTPNNEHSNTTSSHPF